MVSLVRKQIYLDEDIDRQLKAEAARRGISQAAVIRERLGAPSMTPAPIRDAKAYGELMEHLARVRRTAKDPGTGWKFKREDVYAERLERQTPSAHKPAGVRGRSRRGSQIGASG